MYQDQAQQRKSVLQNFLLFLASQLIFNFNVHFKTILKIHQNYCSLFFFKNMIYFHTTAAEDVQLHFLKWLPTLMC